MSFSLEKKLLSSADLVALIGHAGPGASLSVRIHLKDGAMLKGRTSWKDDRAANEPVVTLQNPENAQEVWLIPLGGQIFYDSPPKIKSGDSGRSGFPFGTVKTRQEPINPMSDDYKFELLSE
jgi:hypothetical protein